MALIPVTPARVAQHGHQFLQRPVILALPGTIWSAARRSSGSKFFATPGGLSGGDSSFFTPPESESHPESESESESKPVGPACRWQLQPARRPRYQPVPSRRTAAGTASRQRIQSVQPRRGRRQSTRQRTTLTADNQAQCGGGLFIAAGREHDRFQRGRQFRRRLKAFRRIATEQLRDDSRHGVGNVQQPVESERGPRSDA